MNRFLRLARNLLIIWLGFIAALFLLQREMLYHPGPSRPDPAQIETLPGFEVLTLNTADGLLLNSWYQPPQESMPLIVHFHGNAGDISHRYPKLRPLMDQGYGLLLFDYRGFGGNEGTPDQAGLIADATAAAHKAQELAGENHPIVFYGESIGTGVAAEAALTFRPEALILETPYSTISDVASHRFPFVPFMSWLVQDNYSVVAPLTQLDLPVLILLGQQDTIVPVRFGIRAADAAKNGETWVSAKGGHNDLYQHGAAEAVTRFLQSLP
jgi:fermentation-respiration switch protein FrsA (DUF1100 family)